MAVYVTLGSGDSELTVKQITEDNFNDLVTQDTAGSDLIDESLLDLDLGGRGIEEFRTVVNGNVAVIEAVYTAGSLTSSDYLEGGDSWLTAREKLNVIMAELEGLL